ncbi:hypothetical protein niasHT_038816 [Heterodera trifolii]|uniref:Secreted protein n=1 Tax=Heterodera trifolii TaxID=157864 RepID=A0ABD2IEX5_9BILA
MAPIAIHCLIIIAILFQAVPILADKSGPETTIQELVDGAANPSAGRNLLTEYLQMKNYKCATKYMRMLGQLNNFVKQVHQQYAECEQNSAPNSRKTADQTEQ